MGLFDVFGVGTQTWKIVQNELNKWGRQISRTEKELVNTVSREVNKVKNRVYYAFDPNSIHVPRVRPPVIPLPKPPIIPPIKPPVVPITPWPSITPKPRRDRDRRRSSRRSNWDRRDRRRSNRDRSSTVPPKPPEPSPSVPQTYGGGIPIELIALGGVGLLALYMMKKK